MTESWFSFCDGAIHQTTPIDCFEYYAHLNVVLAVSGENTLRIYDVNSGAPLQQMTGEKNDQKLICRYHKRTGSIAITDGDHLGYRSHINGVLVVNTALQSPIQADQEVVMIELTISEARLLTNFIQDCDVSSLSQEGIGEDKAKNSEDIEAVEELLEALAKNISASDDMNDSVDKMAVSEKWETIKISAPYSRLKQACLTLLKCHRRQSLEKKAVIPGYHQATQSSYGLPVVASVLHQLVLLHPRDNPGTQGSALRPPSREMMYSELTRRSTFKKWPHPDYKYALPQAMAETGFYYQPSAIGDDRAMCFACNVCLVCWEPSDEPWSEHERHSPTCPFVRCEPTTNVPMSVTHATQPALANPFPPLEGSEVKPKMDFLTVGENSNLIAVATKNGMLALWDVSDVIPKLKSICAIRKSSVLYLLRHRLKHDNFPDADKFVPANCQVSDLTVTKLLILDKLCPESELMTSDPAQCLSSSDDLSSKVGVKKQNTEGASTSQKISFSKIPVFAVGVSVTVNPRKFMGSTVGEPQQKDYQEPTDRQGTSTDVTVGESTTTQSLFSSHKFSLLLFVKAEMGSSAKSDELSTSASQQLTMSKTTLFHPHSMEGIENYNDMPMPNSLGTIPVPNLGEEDFEIMGMPTLGMPMDFGPTEDIPDAYPIVDVVSSTEQMQMLHHEAQELMNEGATLGQLSKIYGPQQASEIFEDENVKQKEVKMTSPSILQLLMIDHVNLEIPDRQHLQVVANILATENGDKLLVSTRPERCVPGEHTSQTPSDTPTRNAPMETEDVAGNEKGTDHDMPPTDDTIEALGDVVVVQLETPTADTPPVDEPITVKEESTSEKPDTAQAIKSVVTSTPISSQAKESEEPPKNEENSQNIWGKLLVFDIETSNSVLCVSPKEMTEKDEGTKWIKVSPIRQISNLPSDFLQTTYDEEVESLEDEEDEQIMTENEEEKGVGKSEGLATESAAGLYALALADDGEIGVMDVVQLKYVYRIKTSDILTEAFPFSKPDSPKPTFEPENFTAFTYCYSSERLCVATDKGRLAFLKVGKYPPGRDPPKSPDLTSSLMDTSIDRVDGKPKKVEKSKLPKSELLVNHPLTNANLKTLVQLTKFEPLKPRFTATAPVCWREVQFEQDPSSATPPGPHAPPVQEKAPHKKHMTSKTMATAQQQQQRRYLRHPNEQHPNDAISHTRTWNLQPDGSSWSEHLFEFVFPRPANVSHIDFKFVLNRKMKPGSDIKLTLLKHPGLTTSRNEMLRSEQRRRWRHHLVQQSPNLRRKGIEMTPESVFPKVSHLLTAGFVKNLLEEDADNPVLFVIEETARKGSAKCFIMMDGSKDTIVAISKESTSSELRPCDLVVIKNYMRVKVGTERMSIVFSGSTICPRKAMERRISGLKRARQNSAEEYEAKFALGRPSSSEGASQTIDEEETPALDLTAKSSDLGSVKEPAKEPNSDASGNEDFGGMNVDRSCVLFGPVKLSDYVDASGIGGIVTIASRWLVKDSRHRAVLLHIEDANIADGKGKKFAGMQQEDWMERGCNRLLEISVTVNKFQRLNTLTISHQRVQRFSLLCSRTLHKKLLQGICDDQGSDAPSGGEKFVAHSLPQKLAALDILNWVASTEVADPNEKCETSLDAKNSSNTIAITRDLSSTQTLAYILCYFDLKFKEKGQKSRKKLSPAEERSGGISRPDCDDGPLFQKVIEKEKEQPRDGSRYSLKKFLEVCFLNSGREVAVRALRLIFHALVKMKVNENVTLAIGSRVLRDAVMECLDLALERKVESAHGLYCLFQVLGIILESEVRVGKAQSLEFMTLLQKCVSALSKASLLMRDSIHPLHSFLRSHHGLYGSPFDPDRFTVEFIIAGSRLPPGDMTQMAQADSMAKQQAWEKYFSNEELNIQELVTPRELDERRGLAVGDFQNGLYLARFGLIECQPLHFTCIDTSEGCMVGVDLMNDIDALISAPTSSGIDEPTYIPGKKAMAGLTPEEHLEKLTGLLECYSEVAAPYKNPVKSYVQKMQQEIPTTKRSLPTFMDVSDPASPDIDDNSKDSLSYSKQPLLNISVPNMSFSLPPSTVLTVPRMHSGVRRSVVLDFGHIVEVTDIHIPSCQDLSSMTLDAWVHGPKDPTHQSLARVGATLDICDHDFVMGSLAPPVVCRYVRITVIARFGTTNAQSAVNLGRFYGRPACIGYPRTQVSSDPQCSVPSPPKKTMKESDGERRGERDHPPVLVDLLDVSESAPGRAAIQRSLAYLRAYQDDIDCRYSLSCNDLKILLFSGGADGSASWRMGGYPWEEQGATLSSKKTASEKLQVAYKKSSRLQVQRNRVARSIRYMESILGRDTPTFGQPRPFTTNPEKAPLYSQLQTYCEMMLNALMAVPNEAYYDPHGCPGKLGLVTGGEALVNLELCKEFFQNLICDGNPRMRVQTTCLLLKFSSPFPWWGEFLAQSLPHAFSGADSSFTNVPKKHLFATLLALGQRCLVVPQKAENIIRNVLELLQNLLKVKSTGRDSKKSEDVSYAAMNLDLLTWVLLYTSHLIETIMVRNECFMTGGTAPAEDTTKNQVAATTSSNVGTSSAPIHVAPVMGFPNVGTVKLPMDYHPPHMHGEIISFDDLISGDIHIKESTAQKPSGSNQGTSGQGGSLGSNTAAGSKQTSSTKDAMFKNRWNFVFISGDEGKNMPGCSANTKILSWMQLINANLKYHKSQLLKILKEKRELAKAIEKMGSETQTIEYTTLKAKKKQLSNKASIHHRTIIGYRRSLDRKALRKQLQKTKPVDENKKGSESIPFPAAFVGVSVETCRTVIRSLLGLLLKLDITVASDFAVLACKLSSQLCRWTSAQCIYTAGQRSPEENERRITRPIFLSEILQPEDLKKILLLAAGGSQTPQKGWGPIPGPPAGHYAGPWVNHALSSMLQDILESENTAMSSCENELFPTSHDSYEKYMAGEEMQEEPSTSKSSGTQTEEDPGIFDVDETEISLKDKEENMHNTDLKRMELVDNFIKISEDFIAEIKSMMKTDNVEQKRKEDKKEESRTALPKPEFSTPLKSKSPTKSSSVIDELDASQSVLKPLSVFLRRIRLGARKAGKVSATGGNRHLLCSHMYDSRSILGVSRSLELTLKFWTMGHLKLVSKSITSPSTALVEDYGDKESNKVQDERPETHAMTSFLCLRKCICEILQESSSYCVPLSNLCELVLSLQDTYNETLDQDCEFVTEIPTLLGEEGAGALLKAVNGPHGFNIHHHPQLGSMVLDLIRTVVDDNFAFMATAEHTNSLLSPQFGLSRFFVGILSSKMSATNVGTGYFNRGVSLLGPSICSKIKDLLRRFDEISILGQTLVTEVVWQMQNPVILYGNFLVSIVHELCEIGAFHHASATPTDAQLVVVEALVKMITRSACQKDINWKTDVSSVVTIIDHIAKTAHSYLSWSETAVKSDSNRGVNPRSCMTGLFSSLFTLNASSRVDSPRDSLMLQLLKLGVELVWMGGPRGFLACRRASSVVSMESANEQESPQEAMEIDAEQKLSEESIKEMEVDGPKGKSATKQLGTSKQEKRESFGNVILRKEEIIQHLMASLALCTGTAMASLFRTLKIPAVSAIERGPSSTADGVLVLLAAIFDSATDDSLRVKAVLNYLAGPAMEDGKYFPQATCLPTSQLSLPLLWIMLFVFDDTERAEHFCSLGGARFIADSLVGSAKESIEQSQGRTSQVLQYLTAASDRATAYAPRPPVALHNEGNWMSLGTSKAVQKVTAGGQGFNYPPLQGSINAGVPGPTVKVLSPQIKDNKEFDFAAVATIKCSDVSAQPADSLLKPKAVHRRSRAPLWSYHFSDSEHWVSLTLQFPTVFVLKTVKLTPMVMSLSTSPSAVVVEVNRSGSTNRSSFQPLSVPMETSGMGDIVVAPPCDEVVAAIRIHMKRPMNSASIGLTKIAVNGISDFMSYDGSYKSVPPKILTKNFINSAEKNRKSTLNWLSLLHHFLTLSDMKLAPMFHNVILEVDGLIPTLCALIEHPVNSILLPTVENALLLAAIPEKIPELVECLFNGSSGARSHYFLGGFSHSASESSIHLIHSLCDKDSKDLKLRLEAMLKWVLESIPATNTATNNSVDAAHLHALACGIWYCSATQAAKDCITLQLAQAVYQWSQGLHERQRMDVTYYSSPLKNSLDWLLCSFCNVNVEIYIALLGWMGLQDSLMTSSCLTNSQIETLTATSQTEECIKILGSQGIVQLFSNALQRFCQHLMEAYQIPVEEERVTSDAVMEVTPVNVIPVIEFFSGLSKISLVQEWLGTEGGAKTWQILLKTLYYVTSTLRQFSSVSHASVLSHNVLLDLQESTINLLKHATNCNEHNQKLFTKAICDIISLQPERTSHSTQLSGFVRALLLRVVLEDESCIVMMKCSSGEKFYKGKSNSFVNSVATLRHPAFETGHFSRTYEIGVSSSLDQVWAMASDAPFGWDKAQKKATKAWTQKSILKIDDIISSNADKPISAQPTVLHMPFGHPPPPSMTYAQAVKPQTSAVTSSSSLGDLLIGVVAGENAKLKRKTKVAKLSETPQVDVKGTVLVPMLELKCPDIGAEKMKQNSTLSQLLAEYKSQGTQKLLKCITLDVHASFGFKSTKEAPKTKEGNSEENVTMETNESETPHKQEKDGEPDAKTSAKQSQPTTVQPLKTMLEVFASLDGLALVAERLPNVTLDISQTPVTDFSQSQPAEPPQMGPMDLYYHYGSNVPGWMDDEDWFGCEEEPPDIMDDVYYNGHLKMFPKPPMKKPPPQSITSTSSGNPGVPSHTMSALCFFLRVPHFAEEFLSKQKAARSLLRLLLGVQDDGTGEQILKLDLAQSLPMLPFTAICTLLSRHEPLSDSGMAIREAMTFSTTSIHLVLACLSRFTQSEPDEDTPAGRLLASLLPEQEVAPINVAPPSYKGPTMQAGSSKKVNFTNKPGEKQYWAKGTGFGTGSTTSDWDVGNAVKKQKKNEGYVTILLEVLTNFVCPESCDGSAMPAERKTLPMDGKFKAVIPELLSASGLIPAIASYLRNDSVLDIAHHVPLYCSLLSTIRSFALCPVLCRLLMDSSRTVRQSPDGSSTPLTSDTVVSLLTKMRKCIDTYASRLKSINTSIDNQGEEGLTTFVLNVQKTESMLTKFAEEIKSKELSQSKDSDRLSDTAKSPTLVSRLSAASLEKRYVEEMKNLQFDTAELVIEQDGGNFKFPSGHHFHGKIKETVNVADASRARRLAQETVTLSNSLPLSYSSTVLVRCDEERLDVMKVLITGPCDTPYSNGCFEFDIFFPSDYNNSPPLVNLRTTGNGAIRFNPNLYNDGKVCLSILNTWHGRPEEKWNPQTSSFLQILVSIQSLIFVSEPYFNEPGYERSRGTPMGEQSSREYDANIQQATVRYAMLEQLKNPSSCFKDAIRCHFWLKRDEILAQCDKWMAEMKMRANERHGRRTIAHHYTALQRHATLLKTELTKMTCPEGLTDVQLDAVSEKTRDATASTDATVLQESSSAMDKDKTPPK